MRRTPTAEVRYTAGRIELRHGRELLGSSAPLGFDAAQPVRLRLSYDGEVLWADAWQGVVPPAGPSVIPPVATGPGGGTRLQGSIARFEAPQSEGCIDALLLGCPPEQENERDDDCDGQVDEETGGQLQFETRLTLQDGDVEGVSSRSRRLDLVEVPLITGGYADADAVVLPLDRVLEGDVRVLGGGLARGELIAEEDDGPFVDEASVRLRAGGTIELDREQRASSNQRGLALFIWVPAEEGESGMVLGLRDEAGDFDTRLVLQPDGGLRFTSARGARFRGADLQNASLARPG